MKHIDGEYSRYDLEAAKKIDEFLPDKIFDTHAHLYDASFTPNISKVSAFALRSRCEVSDYVEDMKVLLGNREARLNIITLPDADMADPHVEVRAASVEFIRDQLTRFNGNVGEVMVGPDDTVEDVERMLVHPDVVGFKCYHTLSHSKPTWNVSIEEFLPQSAWEVADRRGLVITLHMVRDAALSDPENSEYIVRMAKKYPNAVLILAHCARSFASWTAVDAIDTVKDLENVYFDFSGICEPAAMFQIMRKCGIGRCMWGSDYPVSRLVGKAISLADGFYWINEDDIAHFNKSGEVHSYSVGSENLMATRQACQMLDAGREDIERLFYKNASDLFDKK